MQGNGAACAAIIICGFGIWYIQRFWCHTDLSDHYGNFMTWPAETTLRIKIYSQQNVQKVKQKNQNNLLDFLTK